MAPPTGHGDPTSVDLTEALSRLRANRDAIPWPERRQIVAQIAGPLAEGMAGDPFRSLLLLLAEDPKWEVRKDVADALATIPDNDLAVLTEKFLTDAHAYVRRAAKQSIERRRKMAREAQKRKRGVDLVLALYQELEDQHGKAAADKARRLAEQLYDTLIGATVHEMRSVLTALKEDNAQIIERDSAGELDPPFLRRKSLKIADRLAFMERLLQDMRNYAHRHHRRRPPDRGAEHRLGKPQGPEHQPAQGRAQRLRAGRSDREGIARPHCHRHRQRAEERLRLPARRRRRPIWPD